MLRPARPRSRVPLGLAGWLLMLVVAVLWGHVLFPLGKLNVHAPPFLGHYDPLPRAVLLGSVVAALGVAVLPRAARDLPWWLVPPGAAAVAALWAVALAIWDGHPSLGGVLGWSSEYLPAVAKVGDDPGGFLAGFAEASRARDLPTHVTGHPPAMVLVFWAWARLGATGTEWAGALVIAAGASAVAAILVTVRALGDEPAARRAAPFLALGPFAITVATSADAFFLGVGAWAAAALAVGLRRGSWPALAAAGLLAGSLPYFSYGLLPYGAVLLAVGWLGVRRFGPPRPAGLAAFGLGLAVVPAALTASGFWWFDGVAATHSAWAFGHGDNRPYVYSIVAGGAILGVLAGPATTAALGRRVGRVPAVLAASAALGLAALALSGVTRLEVERIWLPYAPWLVLLTAALRSPARGWLALNAATALAFQLLVRSGW